MFSGPRIGTFNLVQRLRRVSGVPVCRGTCSRAVSGLVCRAPTPGTARGTDKHRLPYSRGRTESDPVWLPAVDLTDRPAGLKCAFLLAAEGELLSSVVTVPRSS